MTGIERLREWADGYAELSKDHTTIDVVPSGVVTLLSDIADKIERERACAADVSMSAYDLLPKEERDAIAWVREHGGLDQVKIDYDVYEGFSGLVDRIAARLGVSVEGLDDQDAEPIVTSALDRRLMPEGMEWLVEVWPRFEDGWPVRFLDDFERYGDENSVSVVNMYSDGSFALNFRAYSKGERVKRPAPKVLDADGAEIRVGDTVYQMGCKYRVSHLHGANGKVRIVYENSGRWVDPKTLTHRAPVLAADGKPLREGETVWDTNGDELVIGALEDGGHTVTCRYVDVGDAIPAHGMWSPSDLTHERPDTWERIEADCMQDAKDYCEEHGIEPEYPKHSGKAKCEDLVRRAKKLAGVE